MLALQLALTLSLLAVCAFVPGFFFLKRLSWRPLEKLCGSIGLSLIFLYLVFWTIYILSPTMVTIASIGTSILCVGLAIFLRADVLQFIRIFRVRHALLGFSFLLFWSFLALSMIRTYSGAEWSCDWLEHFQRSLFFLQGFEPHNPVVCGYVLPARPPMMNVLAAFFMAPTQDSYELFQAIFTFLNLLVFLPCCLLLPALGKLRKASITLLVALFALNPVMVQTSTYPWTKSLAAFFILLAVWFYLAGWRKNDSQRMLAAFLALAAAVLVHYSAGPYCLFFGLHYLLVVHRKRENKWRELATITALCSLLLLSWFGWSIATYDTSITFKSNTSVTSSQQYAGSNVQKIAANLFDTIVPAVVHDPAIIHQFDQPNIAGAVRDNAFVIYQQNIIFGMGSVAGPVIIALFFMAMRRRAGPERIFWLTFIPFCIFVGIAVTGERNLLGSAHLTLLPIILLGLTMLASALPLRRMAAIALLAGCILDFSLGIFLQARMENLENTPQKNVFTGLTFTGTGFSVMPGPHSPSLIVWNSWFQKHQLILSNMWLLQIDNALKQDAALQKPMAATQTMLQAKISEDATYWNGWYHRHDGSIQFLGDHFASPDIGDLDLQSWLMLMLFAGLVWTYWKEAVPRE